MSPLCAVAITTLAADAVPAATRLLNALTDAVVSVIPSVVVAVSGVVIAALLSLRRRLEAQTQESRQATVSTRAQLLADGIVRDLEAGLKAELRASAADGALTAEDYHALKEEALVRLRESLGARGLAEVQQTLCLSQEALAIYLSGAVETAVAKAKAPRRPAPVVPPPPRP